MYEMEGPRPTPAPWSADCSAGRWLRGPTGVRTPPSVPVARPSDVPWVSPGADPVFSGERFLLPQMRAAQGLSASSSRFFLTSTGHPLFIPCA